MNLLRDKSRNIQFEAFHVFKVESKHCMLVLSTEEARLEGGKENIKVLNALPDLIVLCKLFKTSGRLSSNFFYFSCGSFLVLFCFLLLSGRSSRQRTDSCANTLNSLSLQCRAQTTVTACSSRQSCTSSWSNSIIKKFLTQMFCFSASFNAQLCSASMC